MAIENAKIRSTSLGYEDHGILTVWLHLDYGGAGQCFGGYALDSKPDGNAFPPLRRPGTSFGTDFIAAILQTLKVESWEKLPGTFVRVECDGPGHSSGPIRAIGHVLEDRWFRPADLAKHHNCGAF